MRILRAARVAAIITVSWGLAGCGSTSEQGEMHQHAPATTTSAPSDSLLITFATEPGTPRAGQNTYEVTVKEADGTPLTDATVTVLSAMPAMPAMNMPAMSSEATLTHAAEGRYRGTGDLSMAGTWNVTVRIARAGNELGTRSFSLVAN